MKEKTQVRKRNGVLEIFDPRKINVAITKAMKSVNQIDHVAAHDITNEVVETLLATDLEVHTVDSIHNLVEQKLMSSGLHGVAKEYILYRNSRMPDIFRARTNFKPYEYPQLYEYVPAIRHSYWIHTEFNFTSDIQDMTVNLTLAEKTAVTRAMLAISQIEIAVKNFWSNLYGRMPKAEIGAVGSTFADSEVRHADAYSHLIEIMGLNDQFAEILEVPAIKRRVDYLEGALKTAKWQENKDFFESVILFSMFIENVSLFSQFLVIMSFNKFKNTLKGMSNVVEATSKEENIHAEFGFDLIRIIKEEHPDWWTPELVTKIENATREAYEAEKQIVEWIFEEGDLEFLTRKQVNEFVKHRFNMSLASIDLNPVFDVDEQLLEKTEWFSDEVLVTKLTDFFDKRSINYSKKTKAITEDDLF
jgi:ribonucleoside-diphosphate reductase beta chain